MNKSVADTLTRAAINKLASIVTGKGVHYNPNKTIAQHHWEICPPIQRCKDKKMAKELIGYKFGRFTVIGYFGKRNKNKPGMWVARCDCGHFETRTAKAIRNKSNSSDRCAICRDLSYLKRKEEFNRIGKNRKDELY